MLEVLRCSSATPTKRPSRPRAAGARPQSLASYPCGERQQGLYQRQHSLRDISVLWTSAAKRLDLPAVQAVESKCRALSVFISSGVAATHGRIKDLGLSHPSDVAAYLILRELDDKGRREFRSTASRSSTSALRRSWACKYRGQVRMLSA
jgi:hypothetical protein